MTNLPGEPTLAHEEEEDLGEPTFELLVRDGRPIVSGCYFVHPPLRAVESEWDPEKTGTLRVRADDKTEWFATDVPQTGTVSVRLRPVSPPHPLFATPKPDASDLNG